MKKGISSALLLLIFLMLGIYEIYYVALISTSSARIGVRRYQEDIYAMQNSLDAAKEYETVSLRYSVYQACYDTLRNGGWGVSGADSALAPEDRFKSGLDAKILENLNRYSNSYEFMGSYDVALPQYSSAKAEGDVWASDDNMMVEADSTQKMEITRVVESIKVGESFMQLEQTGKEDNIMGKITLRKDANMQEIVSVPCYSLYGKAVKESSSITDKINADIKSEVDALLGSAEKKKDWNECNVLITDAEKRVSDKIDGLNTNEKTVKPIEVKIMLSLDVGSGMVKGSDEMYTCKFKEDGKSTATAQVTINGPPDKAFPVWNGQEISFEPLTISFAVQSSYKAS